MKSLFVMLGVILSAGMLNAASLRGSVEDWKSIAHLHGQNVTATLMHQGSPALTLNKGNLRLGGFVVQAGRKALTGKLVRTSDRVRTYEFAEMAGAALRFELTAENKIRGALAIPADSSISLYISMLRDQLGTRMLVDGQEVLFSEKASRRFEKVKKIEFFPGDAVRGFMVEIPGNTRAVLNVQPVKYGVSLKMTAVQKGPSAEFVIVPALPGKN